MKKLATTFGQKVIKFNLAYSQRKTLAIEIEPPDIITVISPPGVPDEVIKEKVASKGKWITQKLFELKDVGYRPIVREYVNGEAFMYLGRNYSLEIKLNPNRKRAKIELGGGKIVISTNNKDPKTLAKSLKRWYRREAKEKIEKRVSYYKDKFEKKPTQVKIRDQRKRWGSCTNGGTIIFNYRAIMAPSNVLDYIVVHEMVHLKYPHHTQEFWRLVGQIVPNYEDRKEWLKKNGVRMDL